jgi:isopentenyl phosphate kinase
MRKLQQQETNMKNITLIKLGGSVITHKEVPMMVREKVLTRLVKEVAKAQQETNDLFIIGHGQGSFAHAPALRYKTMDGFISKDSKIGMAITQDSAAQLNRIVVHEFLGAEVPAVSFLMSNAAVANKQQAHAMHLDVLYQYLEKGLTPVTCGDVLVDANQGCTIWSTEAIFDNLIPELTNDKNTQFKVSKVIHVSEVEGVLDAEQKTIDLITSENKEEVKGYINGTKGFDVTGGMWHKIESCLNLADQDIESYILSGLTPNNVYNCLTGASFIGTTVR